METILQDVHHALRLFAKKRIISLTAVATLAIGIGAITAIFSVLYATLLRSLPYPNADRLCVLWTILGNEGRAPASGPELLSLRERSALFEDVAGIWVQTGALTGKDEPIQVKLGWVTSNFLSLLAPRVQLGRFFLPSEQGNGRRPVVILSNELWKTRYGSDPTMVGRAVRLNGQLFTVVGILPPGFRLFFPEGTAVPPQIDVYSPFQQDLAGQPRDQEYIRVIATLRRGIAVLRAQSELDSIATQMRSEFHEYSEQELHLQIFPLQMDATGAIRLPVLLLFAGSGLLLLIVCANLATILLSQASERISEISLRSALGAKPARILRQLLTESILLACLGGCTGVLLSFALLRALSLLQPSGIARNPSITISFPALCFAVLISLGCGVLFGLSPALIVRKPNLAALLCQNTRSSTDRRHTLRQLLITAEVTVTFVLLTSSILLLTTFVDILHVNPGFDSASVLTFRISLLGNRYPTAEADRLFLIELQRRLATLTGVVQVGFVSHLPFDDALPNWYDYAWRDGTPKNEQNTLMADHRAASPEFFETLGAKFVSGRNFDISDEVSRRKVAIIDDVLANQLWPGQIAVGKLINVETQRDGNSSRDVAEVVGIVKHIDFHSLTRPERGEVYLPYRMAARTNIYFVVRTRSLPQQLIPLVKKEVAALDPELPVAAIRPMTDYLVEARIQSRFVAVLFASLAGIALLLANIGIYGVTANSVVRQTREIGIRMAFGATRGQIIKLAFSKGFIPILAGGIAGLTFSFGLTPMLSSLLFGVRPISAPVLIAVLIILSSGGLLAMMLPITKVLQTNPMSALRCE